MADDHTSPEAAAVTESYLVLACEALLDRGIPVRAWPWRLLALVLAGGAGLAGGIPVRSEGCPSGRGGAQCFITG